MKFKVPRLEKEYNNAPLLLRLICNDIDSYTKERYNKELVVTRVLEPVTGESGVHQDYRAIDFRNEYCGKKMFKDFESEEIVSRFNDKYRRNDGYNTVIHHSFEGGPWHFHVQIARDTKAYMEDI